MADETKETKPRTPTDRTVLVEIKVPRDIFNEQLPENVAKMVDGYMTDDPVIAYVEIGAGSGSASKAVDNVAGEAPGVFRAPPTSSWNVGVDQGEETIPEQKKFRRKRIS